MSISDWIMEKVRLDPAHEPPYLFPGNRWGWLPDLCNEFDLKVGAEVGVGGGRFSERLLKTVPGLRLFCIDPWQAYDYYEGRQTQADMDRSYRKALEKLDRFDECIVMRDYSPEAADRFQDGELDFVHLDANRSYGAVWADLTVWSAKVRSGGIVSGCCYYNERDLVVGAVKQAVDWFADYHGIDPWFVLVHYRYPCYLWEKP